MKRTPKLGQHFLTGLWAAAKLAEAARIGAGDTVLEIGPGHGALTRELLKTGATIIAVEKDERLAEELRQTFAAEIAAERLELVAGDVRDFKPGTRNLEPGTYILAANIPYYITGEIFRRFLSSEAQPKRLAVLVQKEVAERIIARDGKESILSISVKTYGKPSIAAKVSRGNFSPPPSVDSAILLIDDISKEFLTGISEEHFFTVVRTGFSSKRKKLLGNLSKRYGKADARRALERCGLPENTRAEDVSTDAWRLIASELPAHVQ